MGFCVCYRIGHGLSCDIFVNFVFILFHPVMIGSVEDGPMKLDDVSNTIYFINPSIDIKNYKLHLTR